jgi:hypothetical protein
MSYLHALNSFNKKAIEKDEYISIVVKTLANTTGVSYNYAHIVTTNTDGTQTHSIASTATPNPLDDVVTDKSSMNYINPSAQFLGTVYKDVNNNVICIMFEQQE